MGDDFILAGEGAIFIQPNGPNTKPEYLGCHQLDDLEEPLGDLTVLWRKDPTGPNRWKAVGSYQGEPGVIGTSIVFDTKKSIDYLEKQVCPFPLYVLHMGCGRSNTFNNWDRAFVLEETTITSRTRSGLAVKNAEDQTHGETTAEVSALKMLLTSAYALTRSGTSETEALNDIAVDPDDVCAGDCGDREELGKNMFGAGDTLAGSALNKADMSYTLDHGINWLFNGSKPLGSAEIIASIVVVQVDVSTTRIIVARGTADAGNPMEVAYSDNNGLTWSNANVGSVNNQYAIGSKALYAYDYYNIWCVTTGGYIYKSTDGGVTWVAKTSGTLTAQNLTGINFCGDGKYGVAVGANNTILKSVDKGESWAVVTGPTGQAAVQINTVSILTPNRIWLGYNDGKIYYSHDGGTTWNRREGWAQNGVTGSIPSMDWFDVYFGAFIFNTAAPVGSIYITINGGYDWKKYDYTNSGLNSIIVLSPLEIWAVGEPNGGTAVILKVAAT